MGRLTAEPEMRQTPQGTPVARFTIAVNRRFAKEGSQQADFINCVAWRQTAEFICRYFHKGNMIAVDGQIQTRSWDGQDGKRQYATEVQIDNAYFTGSKADMGSNSQSQGAYQSNFGYQQPETRAQQPQAPQQFVDDGFEEIDFTGQIGSEDDLPF